MSDTGYWLLLACVISIVPTLTNNKADKWMGRIVMWLMIGLALLGAHQP